MKRALQTTVAENLCRLAKEFKSGDPAQAAEIKRDFKDQSKNDVVRATVYLMEVIGARDAQFKKLQEENKDLKELLKLNNIELEKDDGSNGESAEGITGSDGVAAASVDSSAGVGGTQAQSGSIEGGASGTAQTL